MPPGRKGGLAVLLVACLVLVNANAPPASAATPLLTQAMPVVTALSGGDPAQPPGNTSQGPVLYGVSALFWYKVSGDSVTFVDRSQSAIQILSWSWSFGDGTNSTRQNPTHAYAVAGIAQTYHVTLKACTTQGCNLTAQDIRLVSLPMVLALALFVAFVFLILTVPRWRRRK